MASPGPVQPLAAPPSAGSASPGRMGRMGRPQRWARPLVPIMPFQRDEVQWLDPPFWGPPEHLKAEPSTAAPSASATHGTAAAAAATEGTRPHASDRDGHPNASAPGDPEKGKSQGTGGKGGSKGDTRAEGKALSQEQLDGLADLSLSSPLTAEQQQDLLSGISSREGLKHFCQRVTPSLFPDLVTQNPSLASKLMILLRGPGSLSLKDYALYESALMDMELSLQSIEVVNCILTGLDSITEFVCDYISKCIRVCKNVKDKAAQSRQVRLLCMFIQAQLRNKTVHVQDVFVEVQAFCIEFSRIKEAAGLFKLLRSLDNE